MGNAPRSQSHYKERRVDGGCGGSGLTEAGRP
jgi:hypothetical protein